MIGKFIKSGLSIILALSLTLIPSSSVYAITLTDFTQTQKGIETISSYSVAAVSTNYDAAEKLAGEKAAILTTSYGATSVQYALIDNGEIVISGQAGVYSKDSTIALTNNHMYGIGSVSKIFTTVAVMQLVEQGKVKLDTPIVTYIPEFTMADSRYKDITVRMLLNHSSGIMGSTFVNTMLFNDNSYTSCDILLETLKTSRLKAAPGEFSVYCNDGFTLAQILVERVTGISFSKYIKDNISDPLALNHTKTPMDSFKKDSLVKTYGSSTNNALPSESVNALGAGGIYSSAEDLCQFSELFMKDSSSEVLSTVSAKAMGKPEYLSGLWPQDGDSLLSYGLGWDSVNTYPFTEYGIKALVKGGDTQNYHCSIIVIPEENMAMAILSSGGASTYNQAMAQEVLLSALQSKGSIDEIKADKTFSLPIKASMPSSQKNYEGFYASSGGVTKVAISNDGVLTLSNALSPLSGAQTFTYTGDGKFYSGNGSFYVSFIKESNGNTYLYVAGYSTIPSLCQLASSDYQAQKITDNPISQAVKAAWARRENKKYFVINEVYTSQIYSLGLPAAQFFLLKGLEGYCVNATIIDENNARTLIQIPGIYGRDLSDFSFYSTGGAEYLKSSGYLYLSEDAIKPLSTKTSFTCTINTKGYAHWYKIGKGSSNKKIKVTLPKNSSFSVNNASGNCAYNSLTSKSTNVGLPVNGYIVFVGSPNAKFTVKYVK